MNKKDKKEIYLNQLTDLKMKEMMLNKC